MDVWWGRVVVSTIVLLLLLLLLIPLVVWHQQWFGKQHCRPVFEYVLSFEIVFLSFKYFMVFHCCFVNQRKASILTILFSLHRYHRAAYGTRVWLSTLFFLTHVIHSCNQSVSQSFIYGMSYRTEVCSHLTRMFSRCYLSTFWYGCHLVNTFLFFSE